MTPNNEITRILAGWNQNPQAALDELTPLVYSELRRLAGAYLRRERPGHTLQPTALVHEAYMRLVDQNVPDWQNRSHFFAIAARTMRNVLVDSAREFSALKRGSGKKVQLDERLHFSVDTACEFLALNDAIEKLNQWDGRKCTVVELRYFGGLERNEIAESLGVSLGTVKRDLAIAEEFLRSILSPEPS